MKSPAEFYMRQAIRLALKGYGRTSPNPMVGAILVKNSRIIGKGWHHQAGSPHAEIEAIRDAQAKGLSPKGSVLYVTLEPCCTWGRTGPCTEAIINAGIRKVVASATDPNPLHSGKGFRLLTQAGIKVENGLLERETARMNESFNHWIRHKTPFVIAKVAMTLDGKIATASGESKWITGEKARAMNMRLREGVDAVLVGVNTVLADNPSLTIRNATQPAAAVKCAKSRIVLDSQARMPLDANVVADSYSARTLVVVGDKAPKSRVARLAARVNVMIAPTKDSRIDPGWLMRELGRRGTTSILVEGGGEAHASFFSAGLVHRVVFFYAPMVLGGAAARKAVAGDGLKAYAQMAKLKDVEWQRAGADLMLTARVAAK